MSFSDDFYKTLLDSMYDGVYVVDRNRKILYWNEGAAKLTGFQPADVEGKRCRDCILNHVDQDGKSLCDENCPMVKTMEDGRPREAEVYFHHKDGHRVPILTKVAPVRDAAGTIVGGVEVFSDNSSRIAVLQRVRELEAMALLDPLTGLANRRYAEIHLQDRLKEMERYGWPFGLLFIDIDHFKRVNDQYGHETGDRVLKMVANTLSANMRSFDLAGRWGGEEFIAVALNVAEPQLSSIAEKLRALTEASFLNVDSRTVQVTLSIGATVARKGDSMDSLLKRADQLLYQSKAAGRNRVSMDATQQQ